MENGLGRTGYLLLATVMLLLGGLGIATAYFAYLDGTVRFFQMGLGLAAVAMIAMFAFAAMAPWLAGEATPKRVKPAKPTPPVESTPTVASDIEFEFDDAQPAAPAAPDDLVLPPAFRDDTPPQAVAFHERDPAAWPVRQKGRMVPPQKSDWSQRMEQEQKVKAMVEESANRKKFQERYTQEAPTVRGILQEPPVHVAERAPQDLPPGFTAPGMTVGKCGRCSTAVMAPTQRPLRLKCPQCAKVTLLN